MRNQCAALLGLLWLCIGNSWAQEVKGPRQEKKTDYPNRPVRWIVAIAPGGSNDQIARLIAPRLAESLGQPFVVDNRPGAGGVIGAETVANASPDGHTLLFANPGPSLNNILLRKKPSYTFSHFTPVIFLGYASLIVVASPQFPPNSIAELVKFAKANPGKVSWGSSGIGGSLHVGLAAFQSATGLNVVHVPYKGAIAAMTDVMGGQINVTHTTAIASEPYVRAGRLKILGIASAKRQASLPNVPTLSEQGVQGAESVVWFGIVAPSGTPVPIVRILNTEANKILSSADIRQQLESMGVVIEGGTPQAFAEFIKAEAVQLGKLVKEGRIPYID